MCVCVCVFLVLDKFNYFHVFTHINIKLFLHYLNYVIHCSRELFYGR